MFKIVFLSGYLANETDIRHDIKKAGYPVQPYQGPSLDQAKTNNYGVISNETISGKTISNYEREKFKSIIFLK